MVIDDKYEDGYTKPCTRCKVETDRKGFSSQSKAKDGLQSICKSCYAEIARQRRVGNPCYRCGEPKEVGIPKGARLCLSCSEVCSTCKINPREKQRSQCKHCINASNKSKILTEEEKHVKKVSRIASLYSVDRGEAERLLSIKSCEVCGGTNGGADRQLHIDHCHKTGKVRGVLCFNCNATLGHVDDDCKRLIDLVRYILDRGSNGAEDIRKVIHYAQFILKFQYNEDI